MGAQNSTALLIALDFIAIKLDNDMSPATGCGRLHTIAAPQLLQTKSRRGPDEKLKDLAVIPCFNSLDIGGEPGHDLATLPEICNHGRSLFILSTVLWGRISTPPAVSANQSTLRVRGIH